MFSDRKHAGISLAGRLKNRHFHRPLVLAVPNGGVIVGAVIAEALEADLDVILSRKLRAPGQPELAIGAIAEGGQSCFTHFAREVDGGTELYLANETRIQLAEIGRLRELFRGAQPPAEIRGRTVIVTDDGICTGATILAAVAAIKAQEPRELIVAVPVASVESTMALEGICRACTELVCLYSPRSFWSIDQYYDDFQPISDEQVARLLRENAGVTALACAGGIAS